MSPLLDLQRRFRELGRIRLGVRQPTRNGKLVPAKLYTFRLTSPSEMLVAAAAETFGGEARPWDNAGKAEFEVITEAKTMDIIVPPGEVLSQFWETWSGGGCTRRCDGVRELLSDSPCLCPADYDERREAAAKGSACKPTTRMSLMLRDLPDIGVWRLESHGFYAAVELAGTAELLEMATKAGRMIPAVLRLDPREKRVPGQPVNKWVVPVVEIAASFGQVAEALGVVEPMPALARPATTPPPSSRAALPAAPKGRARTELPNPPALPEATTSFEVEKEPESVPAVAPDPEALKLAQQLHISARNSGVHDMVEDLIGHVTGGRTSSAKQVTSEESSRLHELFYRLKSGRLVAAYDPDGKLRLRADRLHREPRAAWGTQSDGGERDDT